MKVIGKINDKIELLLKILAVALTVAFSVITLASVVARYVFKVPFSWSEQTCRYLFIWSIMLYMPVIQRQRGNLGFDLVLNKLPKTFQEVFKIVCNLLITVFAGYYFYYTMQFLSKMANKKFSGINAPYWSVYGAEAVGAALLLFFTIELIILDVIKMVKERKASAAGNEGKEAEA